MILDKVEGWEWDAVDRGGNGRGVKGWGWGGRETETETGGRLIGGVWFGYVRDTTRRASRT